jgi:hypothetical protein
MKKINRAILRGKPLDSDCYKAKTTIHEYGKNDNRCFCLGLADRKTDEPIKKCVQCKAFVYYADKI